MLILLGNNLSTAFRAYFNTLALDPESGIELLPASIGAFNAHRPGATREQFTELFYKPAAERQSGDLKKNRARIKGQPVIFIQSLSGNSGEALTETLITNRTLKKHKVGKITNIALYAGGRQDRPFFKQGRMASTAADDIPFLLKVTGGKRLVVMEMHSKAGETYCAKRFGAGNAHFLSSSDIFDQDLQAQNLDPDNIRFLAPDGFDKPKDAGQRRARDLLLTFWKAKSLSKAEQDALMIGINKKRLPPDDTPTLKIVSGNGKDKHCIVVDDMGDSCSTILKAAILLREQGAASVHVYLTHWVGDAEALEKLLSAKMPDGTDVITRFSVTDTCPGIESDIQKIPAALRARANILATAPTIARKILSLAL